MIEMCLKNQCGDSKYWDKCMNGFIKCWNHFAPIATSDNTKENEHINNNMPAALYQVQIHWNAYLDCVHSSSESSVGEDIIVRQEDGNETSCFRWKFYYGCIRWIKCE